MVNRWFGVGQFLSGAMGQLYPGGDKGDAFKNGVKLNAGNSPYLIRKTATYDAIIRTRFITRIKTLYKPFTFLNSWVISYTPNL